MPGGAGARRRNAELSGVAATRRPGGHVRNPPRCSHRGCPPLRAGQHRVCAPPPRPQPRPRHGPGEEVGGGAKLAAEKDGTRRRRASTPGRKTVLELTPEHFEIIHHETWDTELERSAESWAETCLWEHGPASLLPSIGQNLGAHWGRYRPPTFHVQAWYDEVRDFTYPHPHECNPYCPYKCSGPVCTHYTQVVWATSSRIGCAINLCHNMNIWGQIWPKAVYLVCNYSPKGNWWGHAPYKPGRPCSACPPSFGGGCRENLCYREDSERPYSPHEPEEETNEIERQRSKAQDAMVQSRPRTHSPLGSTGSDDSEKNEVISTQQMSQIVSCEVRLRDQCKGTTCNRYECPAGCLDSKAKVIGSVHYEMQSSICKAAIHYGILDNEGGWVDVTRQGRKNYFIKSYRNGIQSIGKYQSANSFTVSKVTVQAITCETTVEQLCPFQKPASHCPRVYCPRNCMQANPHYARVIGTRIYSDKCVQPYCF
ncbi:cysteine-rich secretory protein LCCL domain-containing 1 isoform 3-T3 [Porphyrio hochstetteri]